MGCGMQQITLSHVCLDGTFHIAVIVNTVAFGHLDSQPGKTCQIDFTCHPSCKQLEMQVSFPPRHELGHLHRKVSFLGTKSLFFLCFIFY